LRARPHLPRRCRPNSGDYAVVWAGPDIAAAVDFLVLEGQWLDL